jgi:ribosomal protein S2
VIKLSTKNPISEIFNKEYKKIQRKPTRVIKSMLSINTLIGYRKENRRPIIKPQILIKTLRENKKANRFAIFRLINERLTENQARQKRKAEKIVKRRRKIAWKKTKPWKKIYGKKKYQRRPIINIKRFTKYTTRATKLFQNIKNSGLANFLIYLLGRENYRLLNVTFLEKVIKAEPSKIKLDASKKKRLLPERFTIENLRNTLRNKKRVNKKPWILDKKLYQAKPYNTLKEKKLGTEIIASANMHLGSRLNKVINPNVGSYILAIRVKHVIYNLNVITYCFRHSFKAMALYYMFKRVMLVNLVTYDNKLLPHVESHAKDLAKRQFIITFRNWVGGTITNFKHLYKQIQASHKFRQKTESYLLELLHIRPELDGLRINNLPKLPAIYLSLGDCHWGLNEAKSLNLKTIQAFEITHRSFFADTNIPMSLAQPSIKTMLCLIRETITYGKKITKTFQAPILRRKMFRILQRRTKTL